MARFGDLIFGVATLIAITCLSKLPHKQLKNTWMRLILEQWMTTWRKFIFFLYHDSNLAGDMN